MPQPNPTPDEYLATARKALDAAISELLSACTFLRRAGGATPQDRLLDLVDRVRAEKEMIR